MEKLTWRAFVDWAFMGLLSFIGWHVINNINELTRSVNGLNTTVANSGFRLDLQEKNIDWLSREFRGLEQAVSTNSQKIWVLEQKEKHRR